MNFGERFLSAPVVNIDGRRIQDHTSFHAVFQEAFGFPGFYGHNMDAWIDCMTGLDEDDGLRSITIAPGEVLTVQVDHYEDLKARCPDVVIGMLECGAFVNWRRIEKGERAVLAFSFHG